MNQHSEEEDLSDILKQIEDFEINEKKKQEQKNNHSHDIDECCICLEEIETKKNTTTLPCGHSLHLPCFMEFILAGRQSNNQSCPLCRGTIGLADNIKEKLSTDNQSSNLNKDNVMEMTTIQKHIVTVLKNNSEFAYTPIGISEMIVEELDIIYNDKKVRAQCNLLTDGGRLNKQRGTRGRCLYGYTRAWDNL
jgi:hypothetical protein